MSGMDVPLDIFVDVSGTAPVFSWDPDCAVAWLLVEEGSSDVWFIESSPTQANLISPPITFGATSLPAGVQTSYGPDPLVRGTSYELILAPGRRSGSHSVYGAGRGLVPLGGPSVYVVTWAPRPRAPPTVRETATPIVRRWPSSRSGVPSHYRTAAATPRPDPSRPAFDPEASLPCSVFAAPDMFHRRATP